MIYNIATPNQPGFSYLYLFKEDWRAEIANECKESPSVRRVVEIVIQNPSLHKEMLVENKVKAIRFDEMQIFIIETNENWEEPHGEEWFNVKDLLFLSVKTFNNINLCNIL